MAKLPKMEQIYIAFINCVWIWKLSNGDQWRISANLGWSKQNVVDTVEIWVIFQLFLVIKIKILLWRCQSDCVKVHILFLCSTCSHATPTVDKAWNCFTFVLSLVSPSIVHFIIYFGKLFLAGTTALEMKYMEWSQFWSRTCSQLDVVKSLWSRWRKGKKRGVSRNLKQKQGIKHVGVQIYLDNVLLEKVCHALLQLVRQLSWGLHTRPSLCLGSSSWGTERAAYYVRCRELGSGKETCKNVCRNES